MVKTKTSVWKAILYKLEQAAIIPQRRNEYVYSALKQFIRTTSVSGTAFVWSDDTQDPPWSHVYAGIYEADMQQWLVNRFSLSVQDVMARLQKRPPSFSDVEVHVFPLPDSASTSGFWIIWSQPQALAMDDEKQMMLTYLEALLEINNNKAFNNKKHPLDPEFIQSFQNDDRSALPALLSLTQTISESDLVYWGDIDHHHVDISCHLGAKYSEFGFQLPVGEGLGGKAALIQHSMHVSDYRNSEYRFPIVSHAVDREEVRSVIAIPIKGKTSETSGVLYAARRHVQPFSMAQRWLLRRLIRPMETVSYKRSSRFYIGNRHAKFIEQKKSEIRKLLQHSKHITDLESWLASLCKGRVIIVDAQGAPYGNHAMDDVSLETAQQIPFDGSSISERGGVYFWPNVALPPAGWPDLFDDVVSACQVILERQERIYHQSEHERSQWIKALVHGNTSTHHYYDGLRLGLPVDRGEIWMVAWKVNDFNRLRQVRRHLENTALKLTKSPLVFLKDRATLFIDTQNTSCPPDIFRDELLKSLPVPTWIVHGAQYDTFSELKTALKQASEMIRQVKKSDHEPYVLDVNGYGIDSLLSKPNLSNDLITFAYNTLEPILEYDRDHGTPFTKTLALTLMLGSPEEVSKRLFVHTNTVHYRIKRAKELLPFNSEIPESEIALKLSAYIWLRQEDIPF